MSLYNRKCKISKQTPPGNIQLRHIIEGAVLEKLHRTSKFFLTPQDQLKAHKLNSYPMYSSLLVFWNEFRCEELEVTNWTLKHCKHRNAGLL